MDPIDFILKEHDRQLEICALLERLLDALDTEPRSQWAERVLTYLSEDLPVHIEDEEQDLFPMLASRKGNETEFLTILDQLILEHESDRGLVEPLLDGLQDMAEGGAPADPNRFYMYARTFTEALRRHLNWENRIVLPLAGKLLSDDEKAELGKRLADRRRTDSL